MTAIPGFRRLSANSRQKSSRPGAQPSLYHYLEPERAFPAPASVDWTVLRHPIRFILEEWNAPRTRPSLFKFTENETGTGLGAGLRELVRDILNGDRLPDFLPSLYPGSRELVHEIELGKLRRKRAFLLSGSLHLFALLTMIALGRASVPPLESKESIVFVKTPIYFPAEGDGTEGGGGGGGGKEEKLPASFGRIPETAPIQDVALLEPQPLVPSEDMTLPQAGIVMPIEIPFDSNLPVGDITAPRGNVSSSGPGTGGGIGTGHGTGIGPGSGPGIGPGSGGGTGGGSGGGIGAGDGPYVVGGGVTAPIPITQPLPMYTEEARRARIEGIVLVQAIIRKNGTVDSIRVLRGLGYGLDESTILTVASKWRFRPGTINGAPVDIQANIEVTFRLY